MLLTHQAGDSESGEEFLAPLLPNKTMTYSGGLQKVGINAHKNYQFAHVSENA